MPDSSVLEDPLPLHHLKHSRPECSLFADLFPDDFPLFRSRKSYRTHAANKPPLNNAFLSFSRCNALSISLSVHLKRRFLLSFDFSLSAQFSLEPGKISNDDAMQFIKVSFTFYLHLFKFLSIFFRPLFVKLTSNTERLIDIDRHRQTMATIPILSSLTSVRFFIGSGEVVALSTIKRANVLLFFSSVVNIFEWRGNVLNKLCRRRA